MLMPFEELRMLYSRAINQVTWEESRLLPQSGPHRGGLVFRKDRREFTLSFDADAAPEIMNLQVVLPFALDYGDIGRSHRRVGRFNAETRGVKFFLVDAPTPLLVCSIEAILASHRRIPNSEVVDAVIRSAMGRMEEAVEQVERELRVGR
ncbi:MAG: hypothetical protein NTU71_09800 [Verrucomicrobia bacterium]|nr:hypothetical protein [Verrucomicrobiota bacterium]